MPASSFWSDIKGQSGADEVDQILGERLFAFPKSVEFMRALLDLVVGPDDTILDPTAGSGTTAHAIFAQNSEDKGKRKFILVQMPYDTKENEKDSFDICRRITAERVRRVASGYIRTGPDGNRDQVEGLGGCFSYAWLGPSLLREYRDLGKKLLAYEELAKYIFYTETSRDFDRKAMNEKTGKIGEHQGTSYYLLYTPNDETDRALDLPWLQTLDKAEKNRDLVVYCEKTWIHRDDLAKYEMDTRRKVRPMLVPFNLK